MTELFASGMKLVERRLDDGTIAYANSIPLPDDRPDVLDRLRHWAAERPDHPLLSEPAGDGRRTITYGEALARARALRALLAGRFGLARGDVVATLAPAGIDALLLKLACLVGGFVHVALPPFPFRDGMASEATKPFLDVAAPKLLVAPEGHPSIERLGAVVIGELVQAGGTALADGDNDDAPAAPDDWAAIFFTSGSTGAAKGVPITRGMISSNQAAIAAMWPFISNAPVLIDWLPWHHVFGGLDNIFKMVWNGGTLHVDAPPGPDTMAATVALMEAVQPTLHIAVPLGLRLLLDRLEGDARATAAFLRRLRAIFFAGAGIDADLWARLAAFRDRHGGFEILSGYGATEAASTICLSPAPLERPGELGIPLPGHRIVLGEADGRTELTVAGPNVAPCYLVGGERRLLPLDARGFYRTGDAAMLRARADGIKVFGFDGRLAEDFKLSSGVKVRTGSLRAGLIAQCAPLVADVVVGGENRERLVALVFAAAPASSPGLVADLSARLANWNAAQAGASTRIARFAIAAAPADRARGELSDKGQIVQSRYLRNHAALFESLQEGSYGHPPNDTKAA
ncbi:MAG: AMP-binding protein [Rhizobiaceae bacterium]|nr:AMP-binding protein [Rhizobiaceae bacterium]